MLISAAQAATPTAAGAHDAPAAGGAFPPFDTAFFAPQLVWLAIVFALLYWLMAKIALPRIAEIFEARRARIEADLAAATAMQGKADDAAAAYEKSLSEAKGKAQDTVQKMRADVSAQGETRRKSLEDDLNGKIAAAEKSIADARAQAMSNVSAIAQDAAADIVKQLTGKSAGADEIARAIAAIKN